MAFTPTFTHMHYGPPTFTHMQCGPPTYTQAHHGQLPLFWPLFACVVTPRPRSPPAYTPRLLSLPRCLPPPPPRPPQEDKLRKMFRYELDTERNQSDWLRDDVLEHLRTDMDARETVDEEYRLIMDDLEVWKGCLFVGCGGVRGGVACTNIR